MIQTSLDWFLCVLCDKTGNWLSAGCCWLDHEEQKRAIRSQGHFCYWEGRNKTFNGPGNEVEKE